MAGRGRQLAVGGVLALIAVAAIGAPAAQAAAPSTGGPVDLLTEANVTIAGAVPGDLMARTVANAGDVNGDNLADVVVSDPFDDGRGFDSGEAYVVFGQAQMTTVDLAQLGGGGFRIQGASEGDFAGEGVDGAGDVNGDGYADVVVGAPGVGRLQGGGTGAAYVILGGPSNVEVDLGNLGARGFTIGGGGVPGRVGAAVSDAGDVNGDGLDDVVVGGGQTSCCRQRAFVVFGKQDAGPVAAYSLGEGGFAVDGPVDTSGQSAHFGEAVSDVGDVNADGLADIAIGADSASLRGRFKSGSVFVIFGKQTTGTVQTDALGGQGLSIDGAAEFDGVGDSVAGAGDVNGDTVPDIVIAAPGADTHPSRVGTAYVVYGGESTAVDLGMPLGARGFRVLGVEFGFGTSSQKVSAAGDFNGDGFGDVVLGSARDQAAFENGRFDGGAAYVVYGGSAPADVDVETLGGRGFRIDGPEAGARAGESVGGGGDFNGDGHPDVIVGAFGADALGRPDAGAAYLVFGFEPRPTTPRECKRGGWRQFGFRSQGACVRFVRAGR